MSVHNATETHPGNFKGDFLPVNNPGYEYQQVGNESHSAGPEGKFLGHTKGNYDLPPDRSSDVPGGYGGGQHKAGGTKKKKSGMSYSKGMSYPKGMSY